MSESATAGLTGYMWMERGIEPITAPCGAEREKEDGFKRTESSN